MATTTVIIKYTMAATAGVVGQQPYKSKAKLEELSSWQYTDKLNKLKTFEFTVPNDEFHRANSIILRDAFVPFLKPFHGTVSARAKDESAIGMEISEYAFHLTRKIFRIDGEEEVVYTTTKWMDANWKYRVLITIDPDDVTTELTNNEIKVDLTFDGFKNHALTNGFDFRVTKKDGTTTVTFERVSFNSSTGQLVIWPELDKISDTGVTKFYIYYGNAAASDASSSITKVDPIITITRHPQEQYQKTANAIAQEILDSANADTTMPVTWTLGEDIPTTNVTGSFKWKNHFEALHILGEILGKDVWFDNKLYRVFIGTKGKTLTEKVDITITTKPQVTTDNFANIINVLGKKQANGLPIEGSSSTPTDLKYDFEKVVSDNQLQEQNEVNSISSNLLSEFQKLTPIIKGELPYDQFVRLNLESGDIITIAQPEKELNEAFRIMQLTVSENKVKLSLESTETGVIRTRSLSLSEVIEGILKKVQEQTIE